ncbi:hypothetical protein M9458_039441, partial [Cirrhinus mrigala]
RRQHFLNAPVSQPGLFGHTVKDFAQQAEAIKHILPRREPSSARRRGRCPVAFTPAPPPPTPKEATPQQGHRAGCRRAAQTAPQGTAKPTRKMHISTKIPRWAWHRDTLQVGVTLECCCLFSPWSDPAFLRAGVLLDVVLLGLRRDPFEPLDSVELKYLLLKTSLLNALTSIKRVGDLHALSVNESCLEFGPADSHVTLRPQPSYVPKVPTTPFRDQVVNLHALPPEEVDPDLALLCPIRALHIYVERTWSFRCCEQLFVCFGGQLKGNAVAKQSLAHWVVNAIPLAYQCQ